MGELGILSQYFNVLLSKLDFFCQNYSREETIPGGNYVYEEIRYLIHRFFLPTKDFEIQVVQLNLADSITSKSLL